MVKNGLFTYRTKHYEIDDIKTLFNALCHIFETVANKEIMNKLNKLDSQIQTEKRKYDTSNPSDITF